MSKKKRRKSEPRQPRGDESVSEREGEHLYDDWDDLATDPPDPSRVERALEGIIPDIVKRGVDGLISEDGIRSLVKDRGLPKEAVGFIIGQVDATKREVLRIVSKEMRLFLENVDLGGELTKILTSVSFEIRTEVRFIPNDASVRPQVKNRVKVRGAEDEGAEPPPDIAEDPVDEAEEGGDEEKGTSFRDRWRFRRRSPQTDEGQTQGEEGGGDEESEAEDIEPQG